MLNGISVVTPIYNETIEILRYSVQSLFDQELLPNEIIFVLDNPKNFNAKQYLTLLNHPSINLVVLENNENKGAAYSRNLGIKTAKYKYIAFHDGDDISIHYRFKIQMTYLEKHTNIDVIGMGIEYKDIEQEISYMHRYFKSDIHKIIKKATPVANPTVMARKQTFETYGYFDESLKTTNEDYELWIRWYTKGVEFSNIQEIGVIYNQRFDSFKYRNTKKQLLSTIELKWKYRKVLQLSYSDYVYVLLQCILLLLPSLFIVKLFFIFSKK